MNEKERIENLITEIKMLQDIAETLETIETDESAIATYEGYYEDKIAVIDMLKEMSYRLENKI